MEKSSVYQKSKEIAARPLDEGINSIKELFVLIFSNMAYFTRFLDCTSAFNFYPKANIG